MKWHLRQAIAQFSAPKSRVESGSVRRSNSSSWPRSSCRSVFSVQARSLLRVGDESQHAVGRSAHSFELEQCLDSFGARAHHPAGRRSTRRNVEISRLSARDALPQHPSDRRPSSHRLDSPGEGEHIAPESVGQKQLGGCRGIWEVKTAPKFSSQRCASAGAVACLRSAIFIIIGHRLFHNVRPRKGDPESQSSRLSLQPLIPASRGNERTRDLGYLRFSASLALSE